MKISPQTIVALDALRAVNPRILIKPGNTLSSVSPTGKVMAIFTVPDQFPVECALYDLGKFLTTIIKLESADVEFGKTSLIISSALGRVEMWYAADAGIRGVPVKEKILAAPYLTEFLMSEELLKTLRDMIQAVSTEHIQIIADGSKIRIKATNAAVRSSDGFVSNDIADTSETFSLTFGADLFRLLKGTNTIRVLKGNGHIAVFSANETYIYLFAAEKME